MTNTVITRVFETANKFDIQVDYCGHVVTGPEWTRTNDSVPHSKLYYIIDGCGYIVYRGERIRMEPGNVYFIPYEQPHGLLCEDSMEKLYFHLTLTDSVGIDLLDGVEGIHSRPVDIAEILEMKRLYFAGDLGSWLALKARIYKTVGQFIEITGIAGGDYQRYSEKTRAAMRFVMSHLSLGLTIDEIADGLFISPSQLTKLFFKDTGVSLGKFIDRQVLSRARQLLISTTAPVHSISESLGFCDQFYFARKFKSYYRITPSEYRKHHRNL